MRICTLLLMTLLLSSNLRADPQSRFVQTLERAIANCVALQRPGLIEFADSQLWLQLNEQRVNASQRFWSKSGRLFLQQQNFNARPKPEQQCLHQLVIEAKRKRVG
jgi:hypothetical protein